jgi:hypothetical protein
VLQLLRRARGRRPSRLQRGASVAQPWGVLRAQAAQHQAQRPANPAPLCPHTLAMTAACAQLTSPCPRRRLPTPQEAPPTAPGGPAIPAQPNVYAAVVLERLPVRGRRGEGRECPAAARFGRLRRRGGAALRARRPHGSRGRRLSAGPRGRSPPTHPPASPLRHPPAPAAAPRLSARRRPSGRRSTTPGRSSGGSCEASTRSTQNRWLEGGAEWRGELGRGAGSEGARAAALRRAAPAGRWRCAGDGGPLAGALARAAAAAMSRQRGVQPVVP